MQRQRGGLVPIGDAVSGLDDGLVKASICDASPQARRGLHRSRSGEPVGLRPSEADPDLGFMARTMALCSLPRTNPGNRQRVQAGQRPLHALHGQAGRRQYKLPFGQPSALADGVDFDGGRADPKPGVDSGRSRCRISCGRSASTVADGRKHIPGSATKWSASLTAQCPVDLRG